MQGECKSMEGENAEGEDEKEQKRGTKEADGVKKKNEKGKKGRIGREKNMKYWIKKGKGRRSVKKTRKMPREDKKKQSGRSQA